MNQVVVNVECVAFTALVVAAALGLLLRHLRRSRPELAVGRAFTVGYVLRILVIAGVSLTGVGATLRGSDEITFMSFAHQIAPLSWGSSQWLPTHHQSFLHVLVFAAQLKLLGSPEGALRITQVGLALAGVMLIAAAVYDIAGPRAAWLAAWLMNLEIASLFFNGLLLKEPLMELASGLVVYGASKVWRRLEYRGAAIMAVGGLIALGTREYVGWFMFACATMLTLHAALRQLGSNLRSLPALYGALAVIFVAVPAVITLTSHQSLEANLQSSQNANATATQGNGGPNGNNLSLGQVNFSTRGAIISNLPGRIVDILLRPFPWQVGDVNQMLGVAGSLVALACFFLLIRYARRGGRVALGRAAPILYPFFFLLIAYALSVGNAGTGFRYRTHLVTLALAAMVVLRTHVLQTAAVGVETDLSAAGTHRADASGGDVGVPSWA
ncbi:MAG TPA: hypothetical protein VFP55_13780 [Solirubrobacteraceae bacterium]|nr:hypothetical protein [Solirubrobacteraceae bacterium]